MYGDLVDQLQGAVVSVRCNDFQQGGSGFVVSDQGHIVTNNHVVTKTRLVNNAIQTDYSQAITVTLQGKPVPAALHNAPDTLEPVVYDYAILKINLGNPLRHLSAAGLDTVRTGDDVVCLGFPLDFDDLVVTNGIVSALVSRPSHINTLHIMRTVVSNALIQFGSSGGPMVHVPTTHVVGVNTLKHQIPDSLRHELSVWCNHPAADGFAIVRDLARFTLRYSSVGFNHAVAVTYATSDPSLAGVI